eukprot:NODE_55_length_29507_cov_0.809712.p2 type:complete len:720 gc:universal NODE_55_length_29507_cov_0.809712:23793-25952(+)
MGRKPKKVIQKVQSESSGSGEEVPVNNFKALNTNDKSSTSSESDARQNTFAALNASNDSESESESESSSESSSSEEISSDESIDKPKNLFSALKDSEESSESTESSDDSSSNDESTSESSTESSSSSSSDSSSSSGFFSDSSEELDVSRWVVMEESSEDEGTISKEKKDTAHIIRDKWLRKKDEVRTDEMEDDSGEEFSGRLRWMKKDYREKFLREHGLGDLIKSKGGSKKKRERKEAGQKKKEVKFNETIEEKKLSAVSNENVLEKLSELLLNRNRVTNSEYLNSLEEMLKFANRPHEKLKLLLNIVNAKFDHAGALPVTDMEENMANSSFQFWKEARIHINCIFDILEDNRDIIIHEMYEPLPEEDSLLDENVSYENEKRLKGSIIGIVERIDEEFTKLLQGIDQSDISSYQMIYGDEFYIIELLLRAVTVFNRQQDLLKSKDKTGYCRLSIRLIEKLYYRPAKINQEIFKVLISSHKSKWTFEEDPFKLIVKECKFLVEQDDKKISARACLCLFYHLAVNDDFENSYKYLTHFYYSEYLTDINIFVLYNRTLCQVALCAFRHGKYEIVTELLEGFVQSAKIKELLGQTSNSFSESHVESDEFESTEKRKALPWHLHIPDDVIESVYLLSHMILDIPLLAMTHFETPATYFTDLYNEFIKNLVNSPPETNKDYVFLVTQKLLQGNWKDAFEIAKTLPIWGFTEDKSQMELIRYIYFI